MGVIKDLGKYMKKSPDMLSDESSIELMNFLYKVADDRGYEIIEVPGNQVSHDAIAEVHPNRKIYVPDKGKPGKANAFKAYELGHELLNDAIFFDEKGMFPDEKEHAIGEQNYLQWLDRNGFREALIAGLGSHKLRKRHNRNNPFKKIGKWLDEKIEKYRDEVYGWAIPMLQEAY